MNKTSNLVFQVIILLCGLSSCNAQSAETALSPSDSIVAQQRQSKLLKTQGSNEFQNTHCSLQDKNGNLWFGTTGEGVYKYDGTSFVQFTKTDGLNSNTVWCMLEDRNGKIWLGTNDGVCSFDGKMFSKTQIVLESVSGAAKFDVWSIMQDKAGKIWFATTQGICCFSGGMFSKFTEGDVYKGFDSNKMEYILEDKSGKYWFGGRGNKGVFCYDGNTFLNIELKGDNWAWPAMEDSKGNIWFSSWLGVFCYDGKTYANFSVENGLCNNIITRIYEDKKGNIWFGSDKNDGGICRYDGKKFDHFTTKNGLVNNAIWTFIEDQKGFLWVGTRNTGLSRYDGKTFTSFSE